MSNPRLTILSEVLRGQTFELTKDIYTIGRSEDKDITIVDPTVSGLHAILTRGDDGAYTVKDNGSTNGTRINGVIITEQQIQTSDILQVGGVEIMYDHEDEAPSRNDGKRTTIHIDDSNQTQISKVESLDGLTGGKGRDNPKTALILRIVIGVMILIVLVLAALLILKFGTSGATAGG